MKKTNTGHAQEQPLNCCVMTMGIKHAEQLVLLFGKNAGDTAYESAF